MPRLIKNPKVVSTDKLNANNKALLLAVGAYMEAWRQRTGRKDVFIARAIGGNRQSVYGIRKARSQYVSINYLSCIAIAMDTDVVTMIIEGERLRAEANPEPVKPIYT